MEIGISKKVAYKKQLEDIIVDVSWGKISKTLAMRLPSWSLECSLLAGPISWEFKS